MLINPCLIFVNFFFLQSLQERGVAEILSIGFSSFLGMREKPGEGDQIGSRLLGTGRPLARLATFSRRETGSSAWREPWFSTMEELPMEEKPSGRWMSIRLFMKEKQLLHHQLVQLQRCGFCMHAISFFYWILIFHGNKTMRGLCVQSLHFRVFCWSIRDYIQIARIISTINLTH